MGLFDGGHPQKSALCQLDHCNNSDQISRNNYPPSKTNEAPYQMIGRKTLASTLGHKELNHGHFWLSLLSECLSCYLYVFIVCSTRISWTGSIIGHEPNIIAIALTSGIAMMLLIFTFRTVHVNPALTISFLVTGRVPIIRAFLYILVQCVGAVAAVASLYSISIKGHAGALGLDNPHDNLTSLQILCVEIVISFMVTLTTFATCTYSSYTSAKRYTLEQVGSSPSLLTAPGCDTVNPYRHSRWSVAPADNNFEYEYDNHRIYAAQQLKPDSSSQVPTEEIMQDESQLLSPNGFSIRVTSGQAFVIGLAYTMTSLCGIPASGASLNPARSFGPAFIMGRYERHWIYWLGPILGAVIAGFFFEFIFSPTRKTSLCYRPKLFRLSAHDMARVGSKSRLYQHHQQKHMPSNFSVPQASSTYQFHQSGPQLPPLIPSSSYPHHPQQSSIATIRPQNHHQTIHHSPSTRGLVSGPIQTNEFRSMEAVMMTGSQRPAVYDDPLLQHATQGHNTNFRPANNMQSLAAGHHNHTTNRGLSGQFPVCQSPPEPTHQKPFNTVHSRPGFQANGRPFSVAVPDHPVSLQQGLRHEPFPVCTRQLTNGQQNRLEKLGVAKGLDDDNAELYDVLRESHPVVMPVRHHIVHDNININNVSISHDFSHHPGSSYENSDASQRTSETLSFGANDRQRSPL